MEERLVTFVVVVVLMILVDVVVFIVVVVVVVFVVGHFPAGLTSLTALSYLVLPRL